MPNSIITVPGLEIFTAEIEESCPIIEDARSTQTGLRGRKGGKIKVAIPDPGHTFVKKGGIPTIGAGGDITNTDVKEFEREFTICVATNAAGINSLEKVSTSTPSRTKSQPPVLRNSAPPYRKPSSPSPAFTPTPCSSRTARAPALTVTAFFPTWPEPSRTPAAAVNSSAT